MSAADPNPMSTRSSRRSIALRRPFRIGLAAALVVGMLLFVLRSVGSADEPAPGLRDGWKWRTTIPPVKFADTVSAGRSVKDNNVSFPVTIDNGPTAKRYRVDALPNCFLIDKSGKVVWGYGMAPPTDAQIEELLK
jgi:hypothetical protein